MLFTKERIAELIGRDVRTIERWIAAGKFPGGIKVADNTVRWPIDTLKQWAQQHGQDMAEVFERAAALPAPAKIRNVPLAARMAAAASKTAGKKIEAADVIGVTVKASPDEIVEQTDKAREAFLIAAFQAGQRLDPTRSWLVAAAMFPAISENIRHILRNAMWEPPAGDELLALGLDILDQAVTGKIQGPTNNPQERWNPIEPAPK